MLINYPNSGYLLRIRHIQTTPNPDENSFQHDLCWVYDINWCEENCYLSFDFNLVVPLYDKVMCRVINLTQTPAHSNKHNLDFTSKNSFSNLTVESILLA